MASIHAIDKDISNLVTFASPAIGARNQFCSAGKRYYIDTSWGSDPVPGLPPWQSHTSSGKELEGSFNWFSREYNLRDRGCGDQTGGESQRVAKDESPVNIVRKRATYKAAISELCF